ncbi:hypothetical protein [Caulobacter sp.]|uniref:hypothetical protein n=1 Tax=Caulobacter sp. TaxID=78 RepID=UPI001B151F18|nr:hypothetical protein [Caulobacter sp.]MBO9545804.1 hypothetical protein [Caulobacter sp.]
MNESRDNNGLQQQQSDAQRQQAGQQNQQAETRSPPQQSNERQQPQPDQQNQQADRDRRADEGVEGTGQDDLDNGAVGGVDIGGDLRPGRTGDGGAER